MPRSPVTNVINAFNSLTEDEKKLCLDFIAPEPEPEPQVKKPSKKLSKSRKGQCAACDYSKVAPIHHDSTLVGYHVYQPTAKSAKAQSLENVITSSREAKADSNGGADLEPEDFGPRCGTCGNGEQYQDHFEPSPNYHPFESSAPVVEKKSRKKGAAASSTLSTETNSENALAVGAGGD